MRLPATPTTTTLWRELRDDVRRQYPAGRVIVAVDGVDAAGRSVFALRDASPREAASVVVVDNSDFAHPRRIPGCAG